MIVTSDCGCELDLWVSDSGAWGGCCCGECYNSWGNEYTVEDVTMINPCAKHGGS